MGEDDLGSPGFAKSLRSLIDALATFEREAEFLAARFAAPSMRGTIAAIQRLLGESLRRDAIRVDILEALFAPGGIDMSNLTKLIANALGLTDLESFELLRSEVRELGEQVARLRERELALAGGVSQLRARAARFDEALAGLARVQGRCVSRLDKQMERAHRLEQLASRRDDHITRLIRDTAGQRAELEKLARAVAELGNADGERSGAEVRTALEEVRARLEQIEKRHHELKQAHAGGTQRVIETLESLRERIGRLESRAAEMSREARAKAGRLDALARHVTVVEARLSTALGGKPDTAVVPLAKDVERSMQAPG